MGFRAWCAHEDEGGRVVYAPLSPSEREALGKLRLLEELMVKAVEMGEVARSVGAESVSFTFKLDHNLYPRADVVFSLSGAITVRLYDEHGRYSNIRLFTEGEERRIRKAGLLREGAGLNMR